MAADPLVTRGVFSVLNVVLFLWGIVSMILLLRIKYIDNQLSSLDYTTSTHEATTDNMDSPTVVFVLVGATASGICILLSLLGGIGSYFMNKVALIIYSIILVIMFVAQFISGIAFSVTRNTFPAYYISFTSDAWSSDTVVRNLVQNNLGCCGLTTLTDQPYIPCPSGASSACVPVIQNHFDNIYSIAEAMTFSMFLLALATFVTGIILSCIICNCCGCGGLPSNKYSSQPISMQVYQQPQQPAFAAPAPVQAN